MKVIINKGFCPNFSYTNRCEGCSERDICLPEFKIINEED